MSNLLVLKNRLKTVKSLDSVMSAILVITAAKIQKTKNKFRHSVKYFDSIKDIASQVFFMDANLTDAVLNVVVSSNEGLCGSFNEKLLSFVASESEKCGSNSDFFVLGKKHKRLKDLKKNIIGVDYEAVKTHSFEDISKVSKFILDWFMKKHGRVFVYYNRYKSVLVQIPSVFQIFPIQSNSSGEAAHDMDVSELFEPLISHYIEASLNRFILESSLGELNARMVLSKGASDSSKELISGLTIQINKTRQFLITSELSEIVSSFEALSGGEE